MVVASPTNKRSTHRQDTTKKQQEKKERTNDTKTRTRPFTGLCRNKTTTASFSLSLSFPSVGRFRIRQCHCVCECVCVCIREKKRVGIQSRLLGYVRVEKVGPSLFDYAPLILLSHHYHPQRLLPFDTCCITLFLHPLPHLLPAPLSQTRFCRRRRRRRRRLWEGIGREGGRKEKEKTTQRRPRERSSLPSHLSPAPPILLLIPHLFRPTLD